MELRQRRSPNGGSEDLAYNAPDEKLLSKGNIRMTITLFGQAEKNLQVKTPPSTSKNIIKNHFYISGESVDKTCTRCIIVFVLLILSVFTTVYTVHANNGNIFMQVNKKSRNSLMLQARD